MKQLLKDILGFTKSLTQIDLLLYVAVLILIILVVSLIYIIKTSDEEAEETIEIEEGTTVFNQEDVDLKEIISNIENSEAPVSEFTDYESEQEEKAIISYEELLAKNKAGELNYAEEKVVNNEVTVKKVNLDTIINKEKQEATPKSSLFNYEKEEAFLQALKSLNELLN